MYALGSNLPAALRSYLRAMHARERKGIRGDKLQPESFLLIVYRSYRRRMIDLERSYWVRLRVTVIIRGSLGIWVELVCFVIVTNRLIGILLFT